MSKKITIILADAQYLIRVGLKHLLARFDEMNVLGEASNEAELMELLDTHQADVVILDYQQPGSFDQAILQKIKTASPTTNTLIISGDTDKQNIYDVIENGINSFLTKKCDEAEIINAIKATAKGEKFFCHNVLNVILDRTFPKVDDCSPTPLTPREIEIVRLVSQGKIAKEIAAMLNLSTHTIYTHRKNIMNKLELKTPSELVLYAVNHGIVQVKEERS